MGNFLYLHGGPGMNSFSEEEILGPLFKEKDQAIHFWNEPSKQRPEGGAFRAEKAFSGLVKSAEEKLLSLVESAGEPITLICQSFGVHAGYRLALKYPELIKKIVLVAPAFHVAEAAKNMVGFSISDFKESQSDKSEKMAALLGLSKELFDEPMREAIIISAENPIVFTHYWKNSSAMAQYFSIWAKRSAQLDVEAYFSVMTEFATLPDEVGLVTIPTLVVFGKFDSLIDFEKEQNACKNRFAKLESIIFDESGHFPHLDESQKFVDCAISIFCS
jgi:pimeloyl-ACP methyl ester carboxylesterase